MCSIQSLISDLKLRLSKLESQQQHWLGIAGAPGSGKSTLATELMNGVGDSAVVIPMDGYHLFQHQLNCLPDPAEAHARRGAPFTFDAERFVKDLKLAKTSGNGSFPSFDHGVGDPVADKIVLELHKHRIVIVEGNYLLLDQSPWNNLKHAVFDETWFLDVPIQECKRRVLNRHIATGKPEDIAQQRIELNDGPNAELVNSVSPRNADRIIRIPEHNA